MFIIVWQIVHTLLNQVHPCQTYLNALALIVREEEMIDTIINCRINATNLVIKCIKT